MDSTGKTMEIYCPQLGMVAQLSYCVRTNNGLPCRNIVGCWEGRCRIRRILKALFSEEELIDALGGLPKSRMERIAESISAAAKIENDE